MRIRLITQLPIVAIKAITIANLNQLISDKNDILGYTTSAG